MQAATAGDQYTWALVGADGITPLAVSGVTSTQVAIAGPYDTQALALAAGAVSGVLFPATLGTTPPTASWVTTISGSNGAANTTYPVGGWYAHEIVLIFSSGSVAKSNLFALQISDSIV
jgi:hypothetical protein